MTRHDWGRYTVRGDEAVEGRIHSLVQAVAGAVSSIVQPDQYRALLLIGGYGRGEGGVENRDGVQWPHNNLDFLLVTEGMIDSETRRIKSALIESLAPLEREHGIGIDLSTISRRKLQRSPCLVMLYDMRHGHKTVLGDSRFMESLSRFRADRIPPSDVLWLLVNRGSQLIVSDLLLARGPLSADERRYIVRVTMKAIIAYGDALLFFGGEYHWSYQEKAGRMKTFRNTPAPFRALYLEAIEFRFQPDYGRYTPHDLAQWLDGIRDTLEPIHVQCESARLKASGWTWDQYPRLCLNRGITEELSNLRSVARRIVHVLRGPTPPPGVGLREGLGYRMAGRKGLIPICYPSVAYRIENERLRHWVRCALDARGESLDELRLAFVDAWGRLVDPNFFKAAERLALPVHLKATHV